MPDNVGNDFNSALDIRLAPIAKTFTDSVEFGDKDYYRFTLTSRSSFVLSLTDLTADANVELRNSSGSVVTDVNNIPQSSTNGGTLVDTINTVLDPGTYYIAVIPGPATDSSNPAGTTPKTDYSLNVLADNGVQSDILWRNYATGVNGFWLMNGTTQASISLTNSATDTNWQIQAIADLNKDNNPDIVWRNYATGQNGFWLMNGTQVSSLDLYNDLAPDPNWKIVGAADFNGDGQVDLFWWNQKTATAGAWLMDGKATTSIVISFSQQNFLLNSQVQAIGDFNGDGKPDFVSRDQVTGANVLWLMNGTSVTSFVQLDPETNLNWQIQGSGDFNRDGQTDLLWRNFATGENTVWLMNGTLRTGIVALDAAPDTNWRAISPFALAQTPTLQDLAGNTTANPLVIGPLNGNGVYRDTAGGTDEDYYRFSLGGTSDVTLKLTGLSGSNSNLAGDLDVQLFSSGRTVSLQSAQSGNAQELITTALDAGTYYIRIFPKTSSSSSAYALNLTVNNRPVLASNTPLILNEGSSKTIDRSLLQVTDANNTASQLTYSLVAAPSSAIGRLTLGTAAITTGSIFTQADIDSGKLSYQQNGSETLTDNFIFTVSDGQGGTIGNSTFSINVTPVNDPPALTTTNPSLSLSEGGVATISNTNLSVTDPEQSATPSQLVYTVNSAPAQGTLSLLGVALTTGSTFTQADLESQTRLTYRHSGSETTLDSFTFSVNDGAGGTLTPVVNTFSINVIPVDDAPVLVTDLGFSLNQGASKNITTAVLNTTDAEFNTAALRDKIIYTITQAPTNGTILVNGVQRTTFTQADLDSSVPIVAYVHNGSNTNSDSFTFTVSDGVNRTPPVTGTFNIAITRSSLPPLVTTNLGLSLNEGASQAITSARLSTTDADTGAPQLFYTLTSAPAQGTLKRLGVALSVGQTFTQADIDTGTQVTYEHNGSETTSDRLVFEVSDGFTKISNQTFSITVNPVNDVPTLVSNTGITLSEGNTVTLTNSILRATDPDIGSQITYSLATAPGTGTLLLGTTAVTQFTQADIDAGRIKYQQNGSEAVLDNFSFTITDGVSTPVGPNAFNITIIPVNDPPGVSNNKGLTLDEGTSTTITTDLLAVTDTDGPDTTVTYTLSNGPTKGQLKLNNSALSNNQTFTQADITGGRLSYTHDGSETKADSFSFTASDGATTLSTQTFSITVNPVNDVPTLVSNAGLTVSEGATVVINNSFLKVTDGDNLTSQLTYTLASSLSAGTILLDTTPVTQFTQADVDAGRVKYQQNGSEAVADNFSFTVTDGVISTPVGPTPFNITIIPVNDPPGISNNLGLTLDEGTSQTITEGLLAVTDVDGPNAITYTLSNGPTKGQLKLNGIALSNNQTFTQADITGGRLSYTHDGSETKADSFNFTASDGATALSAQTFSITVNPVNDVPTLVSNQGLTVSEGATVVINNSFLKVTDGDNLASQLTYSLTNPSNGTILLDTTSVTQFTQADVDAGRVKYQQNGSEAVADSFSFTVTDGVSALDSNAFNISIIPVNDPPGISNNLGLTLDEGTSQTITEDLLALTDVDGPGPITYTLSTGPASGQLKLGTTVLSANQTFTQADISGNRLSYTHNGAETPLKDSFSFTASDGTTTGVIPVTSFSITINSVNDSPILTIPGAQTINEDAQLGFTGANRVSVSDAEANPMTITLSAINGTLAFGSGSGTSTLSITGSPTTLNTQLGSLVYRPAANFNGPEIITITADDGLSPVTTRTIDVTVNAVNDAPTLTVPGAQTVNEDTVRNLSITTTDVDAGSDLVKVTLTAQNGTVTLTSPGAVSFVDNTNNGGKTVTFTGTINDVGAALSSVDYLGDRDYNGSDTISVTINDQATVGTPASITRTIPITVTAVNDPPTFTGGADVIVNEDAGTQTVNGWATNISRGSTLPNENSQALTFNVTTDNNGLFTSTGRPKVDPTTGNLTYSLAPNAFGTANVTVLLQDNGGGTNTSQPFTFKITANPVNDAPSFTKGANSITVAEDAAPQSVLWATSISAGPATPTPNGVANEATTQTVQFLVDNNNPALFSVAPSIAPNGTLSYTLAQDANGVAIVTVKLQDNGGVDNGGVDTSATQTFTINVTPVNDAPVLITQQNTFATDEDTVLNVTGLSITDVDAGSSSLRITLSALGTGTTSSNGTLSFAASPGVTVSGNNTSTVQLTGTLANLNTALNNFNYQGKLNNSGTERISVVVSDLGNTGNGGIKTTSGTLTVNVAPVNDAPVVTISGSTSRTASEDTPLTLSGIQVSDIDAGTNPIEVTLSALQGFLSLSTAGLTSSSGVGTNTVTVSGTVAALNTALAGLRYQGNLNYFGPDEVTISVNDQGFTGSGGIQTATSSLTLNVTPVNDLPKLTLPTTTLLVNEDTDLSFTGAALIDVTDVDAGSKPIRITLSVNSGTISLSEQGLTRITSTAGVGGGIKAVTYEGTVDDIRAALNTLIYRGNPNYFGSDTLRVTVNDKGNTGATSAIDVTGAVSINVTSVNDIPVLVSNNLLNVNEGGASLITGSLLKVTDGDNPPATSLVYTVGSTTPANGQLLLTVGGVATTLSANSTFTQADINNSLLRYSHNGGETTSDSFVFTVSDGLGGTISDTTFSINVKAVNDAPIVGTNLGLNISEGGIGVIANTALQTTDADNLPQELRYTLTSALSNGTLLLSGSRLTLNQTFTQADIDARRLSYRHNGSETTRDSFSFSVSDGSSSKTGTFTIGITPVDDPATLVTNSTLAVSEGLSANITKSLLQTTDPDTQTSDIRYTLLAAPLYGTLSLGSSPLAVNATFSQQDIDSGLLSYQQNGSEQRTDAFFFRVSSLGSTTQYDGIFNIAVTPVNDLPVLTTPDPGLQLDGSVPSVSFIGPDNLQVTDVDNSPTQLTYRLVSAPDPTVGQLRLNGSVLGANQTFTQDDINQGRLTYNYLGNGTSDSFELTLSDGSGGTLSGIFFNLSFT